jgi:hypothetical protein
MSDEHEDLANLVTHPGWLRWREYVRTQWGARAYAERLDAAAAGEDAAEAIRITRGKKDAVMAVVDWPESRLKYLEHQQAAAQEPVGYSRRGPL